MLRYCTGIGARATPPEVLSLMTRAAFALLKRGYVLRSGHAIGADSAFERGAGDAAQTFLPVPGWRGSVSAFHAGTLGPEIWGRAREIAAAHGASVAQVALNWLLAQPGVTSVIVGARTTEQLRDDLAAASWTLAPDEVARLDECSEPARPYPYWYQRQFTAERWSRDGAPPGAFDYRFRAP